MIEITLTLPYALPPAELAPDLIRALDAPALSMLLSRHNSLRRVDEDPTARHLPHEAWLVDALQFPRNVSGDLPLASIAMQGCNMPPATGHWFIAQPAHAQLARTHMLLTDLRQLHLAESDSRELFDVAATCFSSAGKTLHYGNSELWFVRADDWHEMLTASPDAAMAQNLSDWIPEGSVARDFRKLHNEIQMAWYEHAINQAREARGLTAINTLWLWGGSGAPTRPTPQATLAISAGPVWMQALAAPAWRNAIAAELLGSDSAPGQVIHADLIPSAIAGDWSDWLAGWQRIEEQWCAPLLAALQQGRINSVTLRLNHRSSTLETRTSKLALRQFWRAPTLNLLK